MQSNTFCASCYKSVGKVFVKCIVCGEYYHKLCSGVHQQFNLIKSSKNIAYNCNNCAYTSKDIVASISFLSSQIKELKQSFLTYVNNNNSSVSLENKKTKVKKCSNFKNDIVNKGRSPLRSSVLSNTIAFNSHLTNSNPVVVAGVVNDDVSNSAVVVTTEPNAHNCIDLSSDNMRIRRESLCLSESNDGNAAVNDDASHNDVNMKLNDRNLNAFSSNNMQIRRESLCFSESNVSNAATENTQAESDIPTNNSEWIKVKTKRRNKHVIFGANNNNDLHVIVNKKWAHISSFKPSVNEKQIVDYIVKYSNIDKNDVQCYKLVKKDADLNELRKVSFKIGIRAEFYKNIFNPSLWPSNVRVRPFQFFENV